MASPVPSGVRRRPRLVAALALVGCASVLAGVAVVNGLSARNGDAGWAAGAPSVGQSVDALTALGRQSFDAGDLSAAAEAFGAALGLVPDDAQSLFNLGTVRTAQGDPAAAVVLLERALTADPSLVDAQYNLGVAAAAAGDAVTAQRAYEAVLRARPDDANATWNLGLLLYEDGQTGRARDLLRRAVAIDPALATRLPADVRIGT